MKKFEFTGETKIWFGHTLHRIRAIKKIKLDMFTTVKPGDLGGWLEKESNLSQDGNAWVSSHDWSDRKQECNHDVLPQYEGRNQGCMRLFPREHQHVH